MTKREFDPGEIDLINRAKTDRDAFGELYEQHVGHIFAYLFYIVNREPRVAEELTTEVFIRALKNIHKYKNQGRPFSSWLFRIARNLAINYNRDTRHIPLVSLEHALDKVTESSTESLAEQNLLLEKLVVCLTNLPLKRRELIILKLSLDKSNREIAETLGITEGAVKSLYHRTLTQLHKCMTDTG